MTKLKRNIRSSQGLPKAIGFSMLPHSHSAIAITNRLTGSQFRLWHYLMMVDPFADQTRNGEKIYHPIPSPAEIAVAIGASQRTVEKDMKRLEELGLYAKRITQWEGYNTTAEAGKIAATKLKNKQNSPEPLQDKGGYLTADAAKQPDSALNNRDSGYLTADAAKQPDSALNNRKQPLQPLPQADSSTPQTLQTYSDFTNSLSEEERESFLKFAEKKARHLPKPPELIKQWIKKHWEELAQEWRKSRGEQKMSPAATSENLKWENHPLRFEWLAEIERTTNPLEFAGLDKEKQAFVKWCWDTKQFSWLQEEN